MAEPLKRKALVTLSLTEQENKKLRELAHKAQQSVSAYVRGIILKTK